MFDCNCRSEGVSNRNPSQSANLRQKWLPQIRRLYLDLLFSTSIKCRFLNLF